MKNKYRFSLLLISCFIIIIISFFLYRNYFPGTPEIVSISVNPERVNISLYWKDADGKLYGNIEHLEMKLENQKKKLIFATNGGMFDQNQIPIGLYFENGKKINSLNTKKINPNKNGPIPNFYLNPNGVFYVTTDNKVGICTTSLYQQDSITKFATQSGPMLIIDGRINPIFSQNSNNFQMRNGVGILPNNELIFAISKNRVTFYDFANYFKEQGCINALYLDGYISKAYMPKLGVEQLDGKLGVIIGITEK